VYFNLSPFGSVADVAYLYTLPIFPVLGPDGRVGISGGLFTTMLAGDELGDTLDGTDA
jgi:hypothetical protein